MIKNIKSRKIVFMLMLLFALLFSSVIGVSAKGNEGGTKIHFISLYTTSDAILLESNGHFALIDSGEDWDYPNNEEYPLREGITTHLGFDPQVIHYLEKLGVEELEFYIATHAHSDHIGTGDEIIRHFPTKRLYINEYKDEYMTDAHGINPEDPYFNPDAEENRLWDNQYVYDRIIQAAEDTGTEIITNLDFEENAEYRFLSLGDMDIEILNYERDRDQEGNIIPVSSENNNCLVTLIEAFDKTVLLTSDMEPFDGDSVKIADQIIDKLYNSEDIENDMNSSVTIELPEGDSMHSLKEHAQNTLDDIVMDVPQSRLAPVPSPNQGDSPNTSQRTISLDLMKMCHHGREYNNPSYFLTSLNPKTVVTTGPMNWVTEDSRMMAELKGAQIFSTCTNSAAVVATITPELITTDYVSLTPDWFWINDALYYFDEFGRTCYQKTGMQKIDGKKYYFEDKGNVLADVGRWSYGEDTYFITEDGSFATGWYYDEESQAYSYYDNEGKMQRDCWIEQKYYVDKDGIYQPDQPFPVAGWKKEGGFWRYQNSDTSFAKNEWKFIDGYWYYFGNDSFMHTGWIQLNGVWYYLNSNGKMATGWNQIAGHWYYFIPQKGNMTTGWKYIGNAWYFMSTDGTMKTGWVLDNGYWYYLDSSGSMVVGWKEVGHNWYYFSHNGIMNVGWKYINNKWYYLKPDGAMATGWLLDNGIWYYLYKNGDMAVGWLPLGNKKYYLNANGAMVIGWKYIKNNWYYFSVDGAISTGWLLDGSNWYYLNSNGAMATGRIVLNNKSYNLSSNGVWIP